MVHSVLPVEKDLTSSSSLFTISVHNFVTVSSGDNLDREDWLYIKEHNREQNVLSRVIFWRKFRSLCATLVYLHLILMWLSHCSCNRIVRTFSWQMWCCGKYHLNLRLFSQLSVPSENNHITQFPVPVSLYPHSAVLFTCPWTLDQDIIYHTPSKTCTILCYWSFNFW